MRKDISSFDNTFLLDLSISELTMIRSFLRSSFLCIDLWIHIPMIFGFPWHGVDDQDKISQLWKEEGNPTDGNCVK